MVEDLEDPGPRVTAPPGRRGLVVPFEFANLAFKLGPCVATGMLTVIGPELEREETPACRRGLAPLAGASLRPGTHHLAVLEELYAGVDAVGTPPSSKAVSQRLEVRGLTVSPKAVDHHVDYLFGRLFPKTPVALGREHKRWVLVSLMARHAGRQAHDARSGNR